jgi:hypothetical protein
LTVSACKSAPSQKPFGGGDVNTGPGSIEYVRRQLQGTWTLDRFEAADAAGQFHPVKANATLTYDQYGNVTVAGTLLEPLPGQQSQDLQPMLKYSGRIVIDTQKHEFRLQGRKAPRIPASRAPWAPVDTEYDITDTQLTITYVTRRASRLRERSSKSREQLRLVRYMRQVRGTYISVSFFS